MAVDLDPRSPSPFLEDVGMDVDDEDLLLSDVELLDLGEEDEWLQFDPGQEVEEIQTREEMERELEEMLTPAEEAALWETRQGNDILTERDCDNLRAFQLKMICSMPMLKLEISSHWVMIHRVATLSGVEPVVLHRTKRHDFSANCLVAASSSQRPRHRKQLSEFHPRGVKQADNTRGTLTLDDFAAIWSTPVVLQATNDALKPGAPKAPKHACSCHFFPFALNRFSKVEAAPLAVRTSGSSPGCSRLLNDFKAVTPAQKRKRKTEPKEEEVEAEEKPKRTKKAKQELTISKSEQPNSPKKKPTTGRQRTIRNRS
ncbi:hypothetical protein FB45DRAFT_1067121 [Roridomyces roridus]|uniref:Uncharacterized protein n=1 Tax=Roridomyces roridus TaxID=1738132 RepID=A0AAD7B422_9AGAR|nr:hypothetical protein FB45DRAFT_1067121 [Roridomyces roridus]